MNSLSIVKQYIMKTLSHYSLTKANLAVRAELANVGLLIDELNKHNGWISVNDRLPDDESKDDYLAYSIHTKVYEKVDIKKLKMMIDNSAKITHWQYLPNPPKE